MAYTTIKKPSDYFETKLWTGNGSSQNITGLNFQPDFVWIKDRDDTSSHAITDAIRGNTKYLMSNGNYAEETLTDRITSFNSDGYSLGSSGGVNQNGAGNVGWNWLGANGTASNTDGSISSTVSANATSGFSISSYTGTGSLATVGHGLGVAPAMIIIKNRSTTNGWEVYHQSLGNTKYMQLHTTSAEATSATRWNNTSPTSTVFTVNTEGGVNSSGGNLIAYCFAEKQGFSKFGRFTANGSTDNAFVYTGFKPAFVMMKCDNVTDGWSNWYMFDTARSPENMNVKELEANTTTAESGNGADYAQIDMLSNGFKLRNGSAWGPAASGNTNIYMAFAEEPLVGDNPATARLLVESILKNDTIQNNSGSNIINEATGTVTLAASGNTVTIPAGATMTADSLLVNGQTVTGRIFPTVSSITPTTASASVQTSISITGSGFIATPIVEAISSTGAINTADTVTYNSGSSLTCNFTLIAGSYYIRIENNTGFAGRSSTTLLTVS